jgi:hypothetical protein
MGDRANIVLRDKVYNSDPPEYRDVFLYTHWDGYRVEALAAQGIAEAIKAGRANDPQYGGRIVTDVFLKAHADSPHLGAGVSAIIGDGDDHLVVIDFDAEEVTYTDGDDEIRTPFADFVDKFANATV